MSSAEGDELEAGLPASPDPLRVCLWAPLPPPLGGISRWAVRFRAASPHYTLDTTIVNIAPPDGEVSERSRFDLARFGVAFGALLQLNRVLRDEKPHICHVTTSGFWATPRDALTLLLCRLRGVPSLLNFRSSTQIVAWREAMNPLQRAGFDATLRLADCVVVLAAELEEYLRSEVRGLRVERVVNMIAESEKAAAAEPETKLLPPASGRTRVIFVGTRMPLKGLGELADAVYDLPDCELVVVGPHAGAIDLERQRRMDASLERLQETGRLIETGELAPEDVTRVYREADIFALPTYREGLPNTLLEAMAAGLPCIATPVGAIPEVVEGDCGVLVPVGESAALRDAIAALVVDASRRAALSERGKQRVAERYSVDAVMRAYKSLYEDVAGRG